MSHTNLKDKIAQRVKQIVLIILSFMVVAAIASTSADKKEESNPKKSVVINGITVYADIADTETEREKGLSGRGAIKDNEGMLFVFSRPTETAFWMKNMNFPIDIIWISGERKVISVTKNAAPDSYPSFFSAGEPFEYALEVSAGFSEKNNIKKGDGVVF